MFGKQSVEKQFLSMHGKNVPLINTNKGKPSSVTIWEMEKSCLFHLMGISHWSQTAVEDLEMPADALVSV